MGIITTMRRQKGIYWAAGDPGGYGQPSYSAPVEIDCRWEDVSERMVGPDNVEFVSRSIVYPDRVLVLNGFLKLGLVESATPASPVGVANAYPIRLLRQTPNLKNTETLLEVIL